MAQKELEGRFAVKETVIGCKPPMKKDGSKHSRWRLGGEGRLSEKQNSMKIKNKKKTL